MTSVSAARQEKLETSSSIAWRFLDSSMIPFNQSPKVDLAWFLCNAKPLQKMNFKLSGCVLVRNRVQSMQERRDCYL